MASNPRAPVLTAEAQGSIKGGVTSAQSRALDLGASGWRATCCRLHGAGDPGHLQGQHRPGGLQPSTGTSLLVVPAAQQHLFPLGASWVREGLLELQVWRPALQMCRAGEGRKGLRDVSCSFCQGANCVSGHSVKATQATGEPGGWTAQGPPRPSPRASPGHSHCYVSSPGLVLLVGSLADGDLGTVPAPMSYPVPQWLAPPGPAGTPAPCPSPPAPILSPQPDSEAAPSSTLRSPLVSPGWDPALISPTGHPSLGIDTGCGRVHPG